MSKIEKLKLRPYEVKVPDVEPVPEQVAEFLRDEFGPSIHGGESMTAGSYKVEILNGRYNTGHGMDYSNELRITKKGRVVYTSGMLKWRNGLPGGYDNPGASFSKVAVKDVGDHILLAIRSGDDVVRIQKPRAGGLITLEQYDVGANKKAEASSTRDLSTLDGFRDHYKDNLPYESYKWYGGNKDQEFALGNGRLLFLNGHPTDIVFREAHVLVIHNGKPYHGIIRLGHRWERKYQDSKVVSISIEGNVLEMSTYSGNCVDTKVELIID